MAIATITLESDNGDSVVVSAPTFGFLADDIILDTDPKALYDTEFATRTESGAFETGGRIVGTDVPIREMVLPFWLTPASRPRFQKLWGTPGNFRKVTYHYDGVSGRRSLTLKLAKGILYETEGGEDADVNDTYHAVVSALAVNPMFESASNVSQWTNSGNWTVFIASTSGTFKLGYAGQQTGNLAYNASTATVKTALEGLSTIGAGNVTVSGTPGQLTVVTPATKPGSLTVDGSGLSPLSISIQLGALTFTITVGSEITQPLIYRSSAATIQQALEQLSSIGTGGVGVTGTLFGYLLSFTSGPLATVLTGSATVSTPTAYVTPNLNTGWFDVWNPTDQPLWLEWSLDPAFQWQFPDFSFGNERKWGRAAGTDAARMVVTPELTQILSVMSDPLMDTYVSADLSNPAGLFNGVEPIYMVPPYTGTEADPVPLPVLCAGPSGAKATLYQRRFWSAESGLL